MCHNVTEPRYKWKPSSSSPEVWDLSLASGVTKMLSLKPQLNLIIITHVSNVKSKILPKRENVCNNGFQMLQMIL